MNSNEDLVAKDDKTLPINWESSGMLLGSVLSDNTMLAEKANKTATSMPDLSTLALTLPKAGSTLSISNLNHVSRFRSGTPTRHPDQKEYDQQLDEYRRENFNLKVRIHFLLQGMPELKGASAEDLITKAMDARLEADSLRNELEKNMRILEDAKFEIRHTKEAHALQLEDLKRICSDSRECIDTYEQKICRLETNLLELQKENFKLAEKAEQKNVFTVATDSDSEASLLNENEKIIITLKSKVAILEQQLTNEKVAHSEQLRDFEEKFLSKENELLPKFQSTGFETGSLLELSHDVSLIELQTEIAAKNSKIAELEEKMKQTEYDKLEVMAQSETIKTELLKEQGNALKREKVIQGLLKNIACTQEKEKTQNNAIKIHMTTMTDLSMDINDISSLTDPSLMNFTRFSVGGSGEFENQLSKSDMPYDALKQRIRELELYNQNFNERINSVSDSLKQVAHRLDGETGKMLISFSEDLSKIQDDLIDSSILFNQTENEKEIEKLREDLSNLSHKITEMEHLLHEKDVIIESVSRSKTEIGLKLTELQVEFKEKATDCEVLARRLQDVKEQFEAEIKNCNTGHAFETQELKSELSSIKEAFKKERIQLNQELKRLQEQQKYDELITEEQVKNLKLLTPSTKNSLEEDLVVTDKNLTTLLSSFLKLSPAANTDKSISKEPKCLVLNEKLRKILLQQLEELKIVMRNVYIYMEEEKSAKKRMATTTVATQMSQFVDPEAQNEIAELKRSNFKLERYAKLLKGKYRRLQAMYREITCSKLQGGPGQDENVCKRLDFDDDLEICKISKTRLDEAVRRLEENNKVLALKMERHERKDDENKVQAKKYNDLKKKRQASVTKSEEKN